MTYEDLPDVPTDVIVEPAEFETEECPSCAGQTWMRAISVYKRGVSYVIYCAGCGGPIEENWSDLR